MRPTRPRHLAGDESVSNHRSNGCPSLPYASVLIVPDGAGGFLVSDFNGLLLRVTLTGEREVIIDTRDAGISLTDFGYAHERKLVVIPTLRGNSLMAFKLP